MINSVVFLNCKLFYLFYSVDLIVCCLLCLLSLDFSVNIITINTCVIGNTIVLIHSMYNDVVML